MMSGPPYTMPQSPYASPGGTQIQPGAITYTTSTDHDGRIVYHLFKAIPASYQTPQGVVHGIQWIPAEATSVLPAGAQRADAKFTESWSRSYAKEHDRSKNDDRRKKKEEKESVRRLSKQFEKDREETEHRIERERRRSFYADAAPFGAYSHSPNSIPADLDHQFNGLQIDSRESRTPFYSRTTTGYTTTSAEGYPVTGPPYRPYTTSPATHPKQFSTYPGAPDPIVRATSPYARVDPIARAPSPYGRPPMEPIARAASPYGRPPTEPIARAASPYGRPPTEPMARAASPYGRPPTEHIARAASPYAPSHAPFIPRAPSPIPPPPHVSAPYARGPPPASPYSRTGSPYIPPSQVYPPGHVMEGQPFSRSRAPSPMPGPPTAFPTSPRMPVTTVGGPVEQQLALPEAFSRPLRAGLPFTPFPTMKIQNMEQFYDQIPRMPLVLDAHDVHHPDWIRFMNDLALAWAGKLPLPANGPAKRSELVADLIDLWNASFFRPRCVEAVLYRGRERRSGAYYGTVDHTLPAFDVDLDDVSSSDSSDFEELYPGYAPTADRQREIKAAERRRKEQKARRKAKEREKTYALYIASSSLRDAPNPAPHGYYA